MAISKDKKKLIWEKAKAVAKEPVVVFAGYQGLTVAEVSDLRRSLRSAGVTYSVLKKSIARKALAEEKISGDLPAMLGQVAFVYGSSDVSDILMPARLIAEAGRKFIGKINILGGIYEGRFVDQSLMSVLSAIPSRRNLIAQLVFLINIPIQRLAITINELAKKREGVA
jgi:large subunit ribosomal protein L10